MSDHQGTPYLAPGLDNIPHSARRLLQDLRDHGVAVPMDDPPWTEEAIDLCAQRGPHPSANLHQDFLCNEMADFINAGFWVVLPLEQVGAWERTSASLLWRSRKKSTATRGSSLTTHGSE